MSVHWSSVSSISVGITGAKVTRRGAIVTAEVSVFGKQSTGTSLGGAPDDGTDIRRCVSWAMAMARPTNGSNLGITPPRSAGCGRGPLYTRYLCTSRLPASWNNRASTAMPDTSGRSAICYNSRGTVHGGNDLDTFPMSRVTDPPCLSLKCSRPLDSARVGPAQDGNTSYGIPNMIPLMSYTQGKSPVGHVGMPILDADRLVFADVPSPYPVLT